MFLQPLLRSLREVPCLGQRILAVGLGQTIHTLIVENTSSLQNSNRTVVKTNEGCVNAAG